MPDPDSVSLRRARQTDIPRIVELIAGANLPPLFVPEYLDGFVVAEGEGDPTVGPAVGPTAGVVACGGLEMYGTCGVIRSVVVDQSMRGAGVGNQLWRLLEADARKAGATDLYLFTGDAHDFWQELGFEDKPLDEWRQDVRINWQFQFISQNGDLFGDDQPFSMWRAA